MNNMLVRIIGWPALLLQADPTVFDRWFWLRRHLLAGDYATLDAGCGAGEMTLYAGLLGNDALGLSYNTVLNRIGETRASILNLSNARFANVDLRALQSWSQQAQFDQIICFETIEHILDDERLIADLSALLKPGGRLLLTTPYKYCRQPPEAVLSASEDGGHVRWGYTQAELRALFTRNGLEVSAVSYLSGLITQQIIGIIERAPFQRRMLWRVATVPLRLLQYSDAALMHKLPYPPLGVAIVGLKRYS